MNAFAPALPTARLIGVLGDTHGDMGHLLTVSETMWKRGVSVLLVLGDFGFVWPGRNWAIDLDKISRRLARRDQILYFLDGNHEDFTRLYKFPVSVDGLRWLRPNIAHVPRGYRATLLSGRTFAALGGANSVDAGSRIAGSSWWPEESITDDDLAVLGNADADIMVGHDASLDVAALDRHLAETHHRWPKAAVTYSAAGRRMFHRGFLQVRPRLYLGGHYHLHVDESVDYETDGEPFTCRVVILDRNEGHGWSQAILDVATLDLQFFARDDGMVTELTGAESGVWHVHTGTNIQVFDLDAGTQQRLAGPDTVARPADGPRPLREIKVCRVGERGYWTIQPGDDPLKHLWQSSSEVLRIERMAGEEQADANR